MSLIWPYIGQEVRKCSSVSTLFCGQCAHSLFSLESHVCLRRPFSIARLCSLSLYIVKAFLSKTRTFLSDPKLFKCHVMSIYSVVMMCKWLKIK